jgi:hypothetical protein
MSKNYVIEILEAYHSNPFVMPLFEKRGFGGDIKKAYSKLRLTIFFQAIVTDPGKFYSYDREIEEAKQALLKSSESLVTKFGTTFIANIKYVKEQKLWELGYTAFCLLNLLKEIGEKDTSSEYRRALSYQGKQFVINESNPLITHPDKYFDFIVASISSKFGLKYL